YTSITRVKCFPNNERESRTDISQVELQLHGLRDASRRGLHQLRREDRGADPRVRLRRTRRRAVLGCLPRGDRAVLLHAARALARAASALGIGRGHGCWPTATTKTARQSTATNRRARPRWRRSLRAGGGNRAVLPLARPLARFSGTQGIDARASPGTCPRPAPSPISGQVS